MTKHEEVVCSGEIIMLNTEGQRFLEEAKQQYIVFHDDQAYVYRKEGHALVERANRLATELMEVKVSGK